MTPNAFDPEILRLPFYTDEHRDRAQRLGRWCEERAALWTELRTDGPDKAVRRALAALGEAGWLAFLDDEEPGTDGDYRSVCLAREALAYAEDLADFAFAIQVLSATPILRYGSPEQRRRYLPGLAAGTLAGAFAVSEEQAGSDVAAVALTAERDGEEYVLNGGKAWIANGTVADVVCVIARTGEGPGPLGLTAFLVPGDTPGLRVREPIDAIAPRPFAHLAFEDCRVPADAVLGRPGRGFVVAMDLLERARMTVGAAALGFARRAADAAQARARQRAVYGGVLFDLPTVKFDLAAMEVELNASALLVGRAAWELDRGHRGFGKHSSIAKLQATEAAQRIVDRCVQLHGAAGLVADSLPERLYRQIRALRVYEGASEVQQLTIAGALDARRAR
ncbi:MULTISPECIES: acyl-CoA dehydrogenase family protein [Kitasatospora]|uniref:Acyl-CoA dehydrogenase family protein n=1 Tax=Kitasatospora cathayae TaxID=3004092 RepID=A0ABY7Q161_9ACTN|nr:acyl-CoA dehydrogenase family protein [Kitasatospora sp. HUAS 3-15]WBP86199.1 acyl-CoA dehydrogenase family protein [Kitasatospora sp. HUAS 3-15]